MSRGLGKVERRIGELFAATTDRALSISEVAAYAFKLKKGVVADRKQRLSATRAGHRLIHRAAATLIAARAAFNAAVAETSAKLGRPPGGRGRGENWIFSIGADHYVRADAAFREVMIAEASWPAYQRAVEALHLEEKRFAGVLVGRGGGWRTTETKDRRLWFHPADYPVRVWAVSIAREGVAWADAEIVRSSAPGAASALRELDPMAFPVIHHAMHSEAHPASRRM